jgi:hypothetical protein
VSELFLNRGSEYERQIVAFVIVIIIIIFIMIIAVIKANATTVWARMTQILSKMFLILRRIQGDVVLMCVDLHVK